MSQEAIAFMEDVVGLDGRTAESPVKVSTAKPLPVDIGAAEINATIDTTGLATSAKQPALGTAGTASADVITVQGIASMTALKVDGSAVTQPVSAASLPLPTGAATEASLSAMAADIADIAGNTNPVAVIGYTTNPAAASFNRPADTTAYASGDIVANSTTAGSVAPLEFTVARANGGSGMIRKARVRKSGTSTTSAQFRLHLFINTPTISTAGDNSVFASNVAGVANWIGSMDITVDRAFSDGAGGSGVPVTGAELNFVCDSDDTKLYGLLEARAAYTPTSGETFTVSLEVIQN